MDQFIDSYSNSTNYPANLISSTYHNYELQSFQKRLTKAQASLCCQEKDDRIKDWGMHMWECPTSQHNFSSRVVDSEVSLQNHLRQSPRNYKEDPICRFTFLHAQNARERLNTTLSMLQDLLSHHQANAGVVDQLLSYGRRKNEQDFSACGFRAETHISPKRPSVKISELGRSGRHVQLCYTLRTIEDPGKWTMRQTSIYHCFDVVSGRAFWLIIKANSVIRERLQQTTTSTSGSQKPAFGTPAQCLESALSSHFVMCNWANENWRAYIGELEVEVHKLTKKAVAYEARSPLSPTTRGSTSTDIATMGTHESSLTRRSTLQRVGTFLIHPLSWKGSPRIQTTTQGSQDLRLTNINTIDTNDDDDDFSIDDMQTIQSVEEKINSALLVLRTNSDTLSQLRNFYCTVPERDGWPYDLASLSKDQITQFGALLNNIEYDHKLQQARLETLVRLLADRKALLYAIIENRNAEANKLLAQRAQESQEHMENMTKHMSALAEKTQQETVSMRIITLVTLFFLPGTFICVSIATLLLQSGQD